MKKAKRLCVVAFLTAAVLAPLDLHAQEAEGEDNVVYRKKTVVSFDDDTIDGDLTRPDGAYVESRKRVRHSNLIKIRDNFREKIVYSVSNI